MDTLCGDCKELEYKYYYSFPHPERWFWYCNVLKKELSKRTCILGGIYKDAKCPIWLKESTKGGEIGVVLKY